MVSELVATGASATVDRAVAGSAKRGEVEKRRKFRRAYLSRHAMRLALDAPLPASIVSTRSYLGDLQMHSTWSDGAESIADLAEGALALGWKRIGVTDHSYGLPIARGMSMESALTQHHEIDEVNARFNGRVRVYKGVEANILADGSLDLQADERRVFEYVIASPHSQLRKDTDQTARMLAAVKLSGVAILGHPQGRMYNTRPGISADWRKVFKEAAARGRGDRARRQLAPAGHRLRARGDRDGGGLPLRARQRRPQHRRVPVHRLRHRPRADRADPG